MEGKEFENSRTMKEKVISNASILQQIGGNSKAIEDNLLLLQQQITGNSKTLEVKFTKNSSTLEEKVMPNG